MPDDGTARGPHVVQVLRTYPARLRRHPFAPPGERRIAHAYRKALARARCLVYLEDQYLWSQPVAEMIAAALRRNPELLPHQVSRPTAVQRWRAVPLYRTVFDPDGRPWRDPFRGRL